MSISFALTGLILFAIGREDWPWRYAPVFVVFFGLLGLGAAEFIMRRTAREGRFTWRARDRWLSGAVALAGGGVAALLSGGYAFGAVVFGGVLVCFACWRYLQARG